MKTTLKTKRINGSYKIAVQVLKSKIKGFRKIGSGAFSSVYAGYDENVVYKVTKIDDYNHGLDGWIIWNKLIEKSHKSNTKRRFPKTKWIHVYDDGYIACMERLYRINKFGEKREERCNNVVNAIDALVLLSKNDMKHVVELASMLRNHAHMTDLHDSNIMVRSNGEWVLTDPLA